MTAAQSTRIWFLLWFDFVSRSHSTLTFLLWKCYFWQNFKWFTVKRMICQKITFYPTFLSLSLAYALSLSCKGPYFLCLLLFWSNIHVSNFIICNKQKLWTLLFAQKKLSCVGQMGKKWAQNSPKLLQNVTYWQITFDPFFRTCSTCWKKPA